MSEHEIYLRIQGLVDEEHRLREQLGRREITPGEEHERLRHVEQTLDQCWDLLRQRRARAAAGADPEAAEPRPVSEVENYQQ